MKVLRHIEAYAIAGVGFVFTVVSLFGDMLGDDVKWSTIFAGLGLVVYRTTVPRDSGDAADESAGRVVLVELRDRTDEHEGTVELVLRVVPAPPDRQ